ncbi:MAG: hypothetical protein K940chlam1_00178 [Candidatus Anoxychlamydiales bacterium]|nr:hypothetical protein [Candidatus Anoxychlamydiales bacterium]NGX35323.1 hypothetical protein [Candidatus Anoxychlamydiales bacterium]
MSIGLMSFCFLLPKVIGLESDEARRHYLDYSASFLRMTQHKLYGQDNHATVVAFEGKLNKDYFVKALKMLFQAHPNLRAKKIKYDEIKERFYIDNELAFSDICFKFIEIEKEKGWREIIEKQLSQPFPFDGPYWKIYCLSIKNSQPKRHYLIQFFDHSLCDGISTAKLNDEFFTYYHALSNQKKIEVVEDKRPDSLATLYSQEQRCSWQNYKSKQEYLSKLYPMPPKGIIYEKLSSLEERSTKVILFAFEADPICRISKAHGFSVNDFLVATSLLALKNIQSSQETLDTSVLTSINLRNPKFGLANFINANNLACLHNSISQPVEIEPTSTVWSIAESYRKRLNSFIDQLALPPVDFSIDEMCERYGLNSATERKHFARGLATSNLGRIDLKKRYGDIDIIFYQFFANQGAGFFEALLGICCIENTIYCHVRYVEPLHSRKWAIQYVSRIIHELQSVLQNELILVESCTDKDVLDKVYSQIENTEAEKIIN